MLWGSVAGALCAILLLFCFLSSLWRLPKYRRKLAYKARFETLDTDNDNEISAAEFARVVGYS
jgi:uncharacterized membrane protein YqjE